MNESEKTVLESIIRNEVLECLIKNVEMQNEINLLIEQLKVQREYIIFLELKIREQKIPFESGS
jgi:hypothetical protein